MSRRTVKRDETLAVELWRSFMFIGALIVPGTQWLVFDLNRVEVGELQSTAMV